MRNINDNVVQGRLSENYFNVKNYRMKYFRHKIFANYGNRYSELGHTLKHQSASVVKLIHYQC